VGETGVSAHPSNSNSVDTFYDNGHSAGTLQDQTTFLHETLNAARDYGGAGYSWWEYSDQNVHNYAGGGGGPFWGLIYANEGMTTSNPPIVWKPAAQEITNFDPNGTGTPVQPPNYYNYYNDPFLGHATHGVVRLYNTTTPVQDAIVEFMDSIPGVKGHNFHYTYTDANGAFLVNATPGSIMEKVSVTATECDIVKSYNNFSTGTFYYLDKMSRPSANNLTYANNSVSSVNVNSYANSYATFTNYQISSSNFKTTAGSYIRLQSGFVATSNSNFNAHIGPYYHDCGSFAFRKNTTEEETESENSAIVSEKILPEEASSGKLFQTRIFPNPGADLYHIEIEKEGTYEVTVSDMYGSLIRKYSFKGNQGTVHLEKESSGVYLFTIKDQDNQIQNFKVVKE